MVRGLVFLVSIIVVAVVLRPAHANDDSFVFNDELLKWTKTSVHLSDLAYSDVDTITADDNDDFIRYWNSEPDQALVAKVSGTCYAAFRGTVISNTRDIYQNLMLGNRNVCQGTQCCAVERGFWSGYNTKYRTELENVLTKCSNSCGSNNNNFRRKCPVVLTGHSQGGSIATTAALYLNYLNPTLITFGQPPTIDAPCNLINTSKYYRFENSREGWWGLTYDPVPYVPYAATQVGHQIMLGETGAAAHIGTNKQIKFGPWDFANAFASHRLQKKDGYTDRIEAMTGVFGFRNGAVCSKNAECASSNCRRERCRSKTRRSLRGGDKKTSSTPPQM